MSNPSPYGQPYGQNTGQQIGASGLGPQMQNKGGLQNSLPQFPMDKKSVPASGMPNMVSRMKSVFRKCCGKEEQYALVFPHCKFFAAVIPSVNMCLKSTQNALVSAPKTDMRERAELCELC